MWCFFFQAEDGIRDADVTGVQTCALPISSPGETRAAFATSRIEVAATPRAAKCRSAAFRMRAAPVRSESRVATMADRVFAPAARKPVTLPSPYNRLVYNTIV